MLWLFLQHYRKEKALLEAGTIKLSISNCKHKLELIEDKIKTELNTRKNDKHIQNLKSRREALLQKYANLKIKLNKL